jgi:hypothetical protein
LLEGVGYVFVTRDNVRGIVGGCGLRFCNP